MARWGRCCSGNARFSSILSCLWTCFALGSVEGGRPSGGLAAAYEGQSFSADPVIVADRICWLRR